MTTARGGHVARDDRAGRHERLLADLHARRQHGAAADAARAAQDRARAAASPAPWRPIVSSLVVIAPGPDEHVVLDHRERGQVDVRLHAHARAERARRCRRRCRARSPIRAPIERALAHERLVAEDRLRRRCSRRRTRPRRRTRVDAARRAPARRPSPARARAARRAAGACRAPRGPRSRSRRRSPCRRARPRTRRSDTPSPTCTPSPSSRPRRARAARSGRRGRAHSRTTLAALEARVTPRRSTTRRARLATSSWSTPGWAVTISARSASVERLLQRRARRAPNSGEARHVRVVIADLRAEIPQQRDDLQRRRLAHVAHARLVADAQHRDARAFHRQAARRSARAAPWPRSGRASAG